MKNQMEMCNNGLKKDKLLYERKNALYLYTLLRLIFVEFSHQQLFPKNISTMIG